MCVCDGVHKLQLCSVIGQTQGVEQESIKEGEEGKCVMVHTMH